MRTKTIEDPFMLIPEGREHAKQAVDERLRELERERRALESLRSHLHGSTPIGDAMSFFRGQEAGCPNEFAESDRHVAERVLAGFLLDPEPYREAWAQGDLPELTAQVVEQYGEPLPCPPGDHVTRKLAEAIGTTVASEQGEA